MNFFKIMNTIVDLRYSLLVYFLSDSFLDSFFYSLFSLVFSHLFSSVFIAKTNNCHHLCFLLFIVVVARNCQWNSVELSDYVWCDTQSAYACFPLLSLTPEIWDNLIESDHSDTLNWQKILDRTMRHLFLRTRNSLIFVFSQAIATYTLWKKKPDKFWIGKKTTQILNWNAFHTEFEYDGALWLKLKRRIK